jgi:signal transduction histidine kinase
VISDFLAYSRPPAPRRRLTNVNRVLSDSIALARDSLVASRIELETDLEEGLPLLNLDGSMLREVFLNIIVNARNAMRRKGGTLRIASWLSPRSNRLAPTGVRIAFSDNGPGIPEGAGSDIFEPFISSSSKGMGLGLSISQRICKAHGGLISATNAADGGARFTVILPIPLPKQTDVAKPEAGTRAEPVVPAKEGSAA